jgi:predicted amidophosphoribosyltransferase
MQYYLCPRCKFHVPGKKNACTTCGYDMLSLKQAQARAEANPPVKTSIFERMFGSSKKNESATEKPALS